MLRWTGCTRTGIDAGRGTACCWSSKKFLPCSSRVDCVRVEEFVDGDGVSFAEYRRLLPARSADFPSPNRVKSPGTVAAYRAEFPYCQVSGASGRGVILECHHIIGGTRGRSDERTNLIMLRRELHGCANSRALPKGLILWAKWRADRLGTRWARLAILNNAFLPDLVVDPDVEAEYLSNRGRGR